MTSNRTFVPFQGLWNMAIDVPYSFLVRDGTFAWSCGQLALDGASAVLAPGDIGAQSRIVAGYVAEILERGEAHPAGLKRLDLYHCADGPDQVGAMRSVFAEAFGSNVLLNAIRVPHFYYDGVVLEVDAFAGGAAYGARSVADELVSFAEDDDFVWASIDVDAEDLTDGLARAARTITDSGLSLDHVLTSHWFAPESQLGSASGAVPPALLADPGAIVSVGPADTVTGSLVFDKRGACAEWTRTDDRTQVVVTTRDAEDTGWIRARSTDDALGLVDQVWSIMPAIESELTSRRLGFDAVVKSTTYYAGGSSAEELHENMEVRNGYYASPGPASTGLPVYGFGDGRSRITVDVVWRR